MSPTIEAESTIDAPLATVWQVLTDLERYGDWNPFTHKVVTTLEPGSEIVLHVDMGPFGPKVQKERVAVVEDHCRLGWGMTMGGGKLLDCTRYQEIKDLGDGRTHYRTWETFHGPLGPLVVLFFGGRVQKGFSSVADSLARYAPTQVGS